MRSQARISPISVRLVLALCLLPVFAQADSQDPLPWLQRMMDAFRENTYQGTFVYAHGDHFRTLRVLHENGTGQEREKLTEMEGGMREVLRVGDMVTCRLPEEGSGKSSYCPHTGPFSRALFQDVDRLSGSYRVAVTGQERVAGRDAVAISIEPQDAYRYAYQLWLDRESAMLLRCLLKNADGEVLERFQFTELTIGGTIPDEAFELGAGETSHHHLGDPDALMAVQDDGLWQVGWMPDGFSPVMKMPAHAARSGARLFTDGLALVSVFVERTEGPTAGETARMGATVAVSRVIAQAGDRWLVTVVGEVPERTAQKMAESVVLAAR